MDIISGRLLSTASSDGTLRAELSSDAMIKILSCWVPMALASFVVGGNLLGSSLECFPTHLASAVAANKVNESSAQAYKDPRMYSNQLDEFVTAYCAQQTTFNYRAFVMMLVAQSVVMFAPHLVWNITTARKVTANLRFIKENLQVLKKNLGGFGALKKNLGAEEVSETLTELQGFVRKLFDKKKIYHRYMAVHVATTILIVVSISVFCLVQSGFVNSIQDNFKCTVSREFTVDCTVSAAYLYRIAWGTNMCFLAITGLTIFGHMFKLHCQVDKKPFRDVGINVPVSDIVSDNVTDCHLMYAFLKSNIDFIDKYNYAATLELNVLEDI